LNVLSLTPKEAVRLQTRLERRIVIRPLQSRIRTLAGFDLSYLPDGRAVAGCVLFKYPSMKIVGKAHVTAPCRFPYIPGLLSFRELPALLKLWRKLAEKPDLIFVDGQGIAHPRGIGIASHFGQSVKRPAIGVAKSRLIGEYREPGKRRGDYSVLKYRGRTVGAVLRTRTGVKPVFVSPGHLIDWKDSVGWVMKVTGKCRIPEPTRQADIYVGQISRGIWGQVPEVPVSGIKRGRPHFNVAVNQQKLDGKA